MMKKIFLTFCIFLLAVTQAQNQQPALEKLAPAQEERAHALGQELRCPVCNGLPIAESPSDFARNMLNEVRRQVRAGKNNTEILEFFKSRYGNDVLMVPDKKGSGLILWLAPLIVLIVGGIGLWNYLNKASHRPNLSEAQQQQVQQALQEHQGENT